MTSASTIPTTEIAAANKRRERIVAMRCREDVLTGAFVGKNVRP